MAKIVQIHLYDRYDMLCYAMLWYDMIWYDMIWYDMIWYDMIWYDMRRKTKLQVKMNWYDKILFSILKFLHVAQEIYVAC